MLWEQEPQASVSTAFLSSSKTCALFFNPLLGVWISDETLFLVFDMLLLI